MKKISLVLVALVFSGSAYSNNTQRQPRAQPYQCDGRQYCSQMTSFNEALFFLRNCPNPKMDGDRDGVPCERQFRKEIETRIPGFFIRKRNRDN